MFTYLYLTLLSCLALVAGLVVPTDHELLQRDNVVFKPMSHEQAVAWLTKTIATAQPPSDLASVDGAAAAQVPPITDLANAIARLDLSSYYPLENFPSPYSFTVDGNGTLVRVAYDDESGNQARDIVCLPGTKTYSFEQSATGNWYNAWRQVGGCLYCNGCTRTIGVSAQVQNTWTGGLSADFEEALHLSFGFSRTEGYSISDSVGCSWNPGEEHNCHTIWYQPLMQWYEGNAVVKVENNHPGCQGNGPDIRKHPAHVDKAVKNNGIVVGNPGCNSGCQGPDFRQCLFGNDGGVLWPAGDY